MRYHIYTTLILSIFATACQQGQTVEATRVNIDQLYEIELPSNLKPGYDMHDYAGLQYYDAATDFYIIGIEDAKSSLEEVKRRRLRLKSYYEFVENTVFARADSIQLLSQQMFTTDQGIKVQLGDYYVNSQQWSSPYQLFYRIAVYESEAYFFQLVTWMPYEVYCERYDWIERISHSFRMVEHDAPVAKAQAEAAP